MGLVAVPVELREEMSAEAEKVLPGATALEAMKYLDRESETVHGVEEIRLRLQQIMDDAMNDLQGTHFDLAEPLKAVEARIAPPGSAAAPYYTPPSQDFSRPGRTWLPTLGAHQLPAVEPDQRLVSRRRPRPPPAAGPVGVPVRPAVHVPDQRRLGSARAVRAGRCTPSG